MYAPASVRLRAMPAPPQRHRRPRNTSLILRTYAGEQCSSPSHALGSNPLKRRSEMKTTTKSPKLFTTVLTTGLAGGLALAAPAARAETSAAQAQADMARTIGFVPS